METTGNQRQILIFMRQTGSIAPLQWLADRMGYLLEAKPAMTRIAQLEAELAAERAKVAA